VQKKRKDNVAKHTNHNDAAKHLSAAAHHNAEAHKAHMAGGQRDKVSHHAHIAHGHVLSATELMEQAAKYHAKHHSKSHPEHPKHNPSHRAK